ncbi:MAG: chemotaxis protein CheW [Leptospiraceae bacterium]|nr:chemotaxis protein CheW [Leptospiraceae bacterium]
MRQIENSNIHNAYLLWRINEKYFCCKVDQCMEVQNNLDIVEVPGSKPYISGIISLRGDIITVIDILVKMEEIQESSQSSDTIIFFKKNNRILSIKADAIVDVIEIEESEIKSAETYLSSSELNLISKVAYHESNLLLIVDMDKLYAIGN